MAKKKAKAAETTSISVPPKDFIPHCSLDFMGSPHAFPYDDLDRLIKDAKTAASDAQTSLSDAPWRSAEPKGRTKVGEYVGEEKDESEKA